MTSSARVCRHSKNWRASCDAAVEGKGHLGVNLYCRVLIIGTTRSHGTAAAIAKK